MANNCFYDMRITGKRENVYELLEMMQWKGKYKHDGLGRIFSAMPEEPITIKDDIIYLDVCGDCAWSVLTAMRKEYKPRSLESESERLNLTIEVYSSEVGLAFQEHVLIDKGNVVIDDCVDYEEHLIGGYESLEAYNEDNETNFTEDMRDEEGNICIGGFGDEYGVFTGFDAEHFM